jgi:hypothetical protein
VAKEPGHQGEHEISRNTIVQGMPGCLGEPVVTTLVCFFISHTRLRVRRATGIPCALLFEGREFISLGRLSRRGKVEVCVIARSESDEAIQNSDASRILDRFAIARDDERGWPGDRRAEATPFFERLCPAMTEEGSMVQRRSSRHRYVFPSWNHCSPLPLVAAMRTCLYRKQG